MKNVAMSVVIRDGKVLVQQRFRRDKGMVFEFPGGSIDQGETPDQAAKRELWEETGLKDLKLAGCQTILNEAGIQVHFVILNAPANVEPQKIEPARQQTFYWFELKEIPQKDFHHADIEFIEKHLKNYL